MNRRTRFRWFVADLLAEPMMVPTVFLVVALVAGIAAIAFGGWDGRL